MEPSVVPPLPVLTATSSIQLILFRVCYNTTLTARTQRGTVQIRILQTEHHSLSLRVSCVKSVAFQSDIGRVNKREPTLGEPEPEVSDCKNDAHSTEIMTHALSPADTALRFGLVRVRRSITSWREVCLNRLGISSLGTADATIMKTERKRRHENDSRTIGKEDRLSIDSEVETLYRIYVCWSESFQ